MQSSLPIILLTLSTLEASAASAHPSPVGEDVDIRILCSDKNSLSTIDNKGVTFCCGPGQKA